MPESGAETRRSSDNATAQNALTASSTPPHDEKKVSSTSPNSIHTTLALVSLCLAAFLAALDTVIITVALPTISEEFEASDAGFAWIGSAFLLGTAATVPLWGKISDIFGRKPILMLANLVFIAGSLACALAGNITVLLVGRAIQGVGAGGLTVLPNITISDMFSQRERGLYLAMIGAVWSFATAIGPIIGGAFTQNVSWRWCFWINLPIQGTSLILLFFFLKVHNPRTPLLQGLNAIDWLGTLMLTGGTVMFLLGLEFGGVTYPWDSPEVICLIVIGVLLFTVFLFYEWKVPKYPIMPVGIFDSLTKAALLTVVVTHGLTYISVGYFLPFYFQAVLGYTPILSGVWAMIMAITLAITTVGPGIYIFKTGKYRRVLIISTILLALGFGLFIDFPPHRSYARMVMFQIVVSLGMGPLFQAPLLALQAHLEPKKIGTGTSTFTFLRMLSAGVSIVIGQVIFQDQLKGRKSAFVSSGIDGPIADALSDGNIISSTFLIQTLTGAQQEVVRELVTDSLSKMWIFYTAIAAAGICASICIKFKPLAMHRESARTGLQESEDSKTEQGGAPGDAATSV